MENVTQDRLRYLLNRYADRQSSEQEELELFTLLKDDQTETIVKNLLVEMMAQEQFINIEDQKWEPVLKKILHQQGTENERGKLRTMPQRKWMYAAAIILVLVVGSYIIFNQKTEKPTIANNPTPVTKDVEPGKQGAILTLSNGKQIVLDSAKGNVATEGEVAIMNKDGSVSYAQPQTPNSKLETVYNTISTPKGRIYQLDLQDGSKVWLNAGSSIRFPTAFTGTNRIVEITGEVDFEVAHDATKPFIVSVKDMQVEVLGTHFNVNAYDDEPSIKTTLLQGKVRVTRNGNIALLKPGQQAESLNDSRILIHDDVDMDEVVAWKNGLFHFNGASLQEVMRQITRWYDVDVEYQGNIAERKFGGEISRNSNLSQVLKILEESKVHFTIENKKLIVKP
jgi:hypothetical protein